MEDYGNEFVKLCGGYRNGDKFIGVYKCKGIAKVVRGYGSGGGCYNNGGAKTTIFGFYWDGLGYWFSRMSDALDTAQWVINSNWNAVGDLEAMVRREGIDLKKVYF